MNRIIFVPKTRSKQLNKELETILLKGVLEKILELFSLKKRLGLKGIT
jgi:hypothetical protein